MLTLDMLSVVCLDTPEVSALDMPISSRTTDVPEVDVVPEVPVVVRWMPS